MKERKKEWKKKRIVFKEIDSQFLFQKLEEIDSQFFIQKMDEGT